MHRSWLSRLRVRGSFVSRSRPYAAACDVRGSARKGGSSSATPLICGRCVGSEALRRAMHSKTDIGSQLSTHRFAFVGGRPMVSDTNVRSSSSVADTRRIGFSELCDVRSPANVRECQRQPRSRPGQHPRNQLSPGSASVDRPEASTAIDRMPALVGLVMCPKAYL